jgi:hypothetical protein
MGKMLNLLPGDYYTQRNNPTVSGYQDYDLFYHSQCMNTSYVMFLIGNKIPYKNNSDLPDDAYFGKILISDEAFAFAHQKYPKLIEAGIPPNQIHGMYGSYLSPLVCGRRASDFKTDLTFTDIKNRMLNGEIVMTSARFPEANIAGHAFCFIGFSDDEDGDHLRKADPWGDFRNNYMSARGYDIPMDKAQFMKHVKPGINKWGHIAI